MNTEQKVQGRRVLSAYSAEDRKRLIDEHRNSGLSKIEFCEERGIKLTTFYGWAKKKKTASRVKGESEERCCRVSQRKI